ncbi:hypothetical protein GGTG_10865 [Gaeumannomyces tritici R3-111a-1]|uniref:Uncharacterized protein n=1 Tax=Gaeumannomyces tritici (strain R3-111a-1) TaxID=644352 RepID=J3PBJ3_GAET3|nr:hypothetical protein GGTG_10865 [Gaeumannomyces tritici R3-111a-1]EJT71610.1 hypothetical protein GGTG_10865 [Gaeumannomyces tritici R3-111a-1]
MKRMREPHAQQPQKAPPRRVGVAPGMGRGAGAVGFSTLGLLGEQVLALQHPRRPLLSW